MSEPAQRPHLGWTTITLFGSGAVANHILSRGMSTFLMVFYNQVMGLPAAWVGIGTAIALIFDAFCDPTVGHLSDNTRSPWGRRHPYIYIAAAPVAIAFFLLWNPPTGLEPMALFAYMMACLLTIRLFDTFFELPSVALIPELVEEYDRRTVLISVRVLLGVVGGFTMTILVYQVFMKQGADGRSGLLVKDGYFSYGMAGALAIFTVVLASGLATHKFIPWLRRAETRPHKKHPLREMFETLRNKSFLSVAGCGVLIAIAASTTAALTLYISLFYWQLTQNQLTVITGASAASVFVGVILAGRVSKVLGKKNAAILGYVMGAVAELGPLIARLAGVLPGNDEPFVFYLLVAGAFVNMGSWTMTGILLTSMIADVVEDNAVKTGRHAEGLLFSADSLFKKLSGAGGPLIAGFILTLSEFPVGATKESVSPAQLDTLIMIYVPTLIVFYTISITSLSRYAINRELHEANLETLRAQKRNLTEETGGAYEIALDKSIQTQPPS